MLFSSNNANFFNYADGKTLHYIRKNLQRLIKKFKESSLAIFNVTVFGLFGSKVWMLLGWSYDLKLTQYFCLLVCFVHMWIINLICIDFA